MARLSTHEDVRRSLPARTLKRGRHNQVFSPFTDELWYLHGSKTSFLWTSNQARGPAEFKHITRPRKRN